MTGDAIDERCATCLQWCKQMPSLATALRDPTMPEYLGRCSANPPVVLPIREAGQLLSVEAHFPITHLDAYCGAYVPPWNDDGPGGEASEPEASNVVKFEAAA